MFKIETINDVYYNQAKSFLESVPSIKEVDEDILKNSVLVIDNDLIVGTIAYEDYNGYGLIRYFVFKKILVDEVISSMFEKLISNAKDNNIKKMISLVSDDNVETLFKELLFEEIDKSYVFIDEDSFINTQSGDSKVMIRQV